MDSEHQKNQQSDMWRQFQLEKELSNPQHPFSMFATGNKETLAGAAQQMGVDLRERLLEFHDRYYSADIMRLCVVGRDSLDQLTEWVVSKFSAIQSKGQTKPLFASHPLTQEEMGRLVRIKSIRQLRSLDMTFSLPDLKPYIETKPARYLGSLLGYEGQGSILSYLKRLGWATDIMAGRSLASAQGFDMFKVEVELTETGLQNYQRVVEVIFGFIQLLLKGPLHRWYQEELLRIGKIEYRFQEKKDASGVATELAIRMQNMYLPPECLLSDGMLLGGFDEELVAWVQGYLNPDNLKITLLAKDLEDVEFDRKEKYYGVEYRVDPIPEKLMTKLRSELQFDGLHIPNPNQFIPDNIAVKNTARPEAPLMAPALLELREGLELWHKQDDRFFLPRGVVRIIIETPKAYDTPLNAILTQLFVYMLDDTLAEITYDASSAGLFFYVMESSEGLCLSVDGFNDKLPSLLQTLLQKIKTYRVDDTQFEVYSKEIKKRLDNARHVEPYNHVGAHIRYLNYEQVWRYTDKLASYPLVTKERLQMFIDGLFEQIRVLMVVTGNFTEQEALEMSQGVVEVLGGRPLPDYARRLTRAMLFDTGRYVQVAGMPEESENTNNAVEVAVYAGWSQDPYERVVMDLLMAIVAEPFFDQLRTKEQLGYITYSTYRKYTNGRMALQFLIQSESNPSYVSLRIYEFLKEFRRKLAELTDEEFQRYRQSQRVALEEELKNLPEETGRFWLHICKGHYEFGKIQRDLQTLEGVTKQKVLEYWDQYVDMGHPEFTMMTTQVWSNQIERPTMETMARYSDHIVGLSECLRKSGVECELEDLKHLVGTVSGMQGLVSGLQRIKEIDQSVLEKIQAEDSYVWTSLEMALASSVPVTNGVVQNSRLANIGAIRSPNGSWVFEDESLFKRTLRQSNASIPTRPLIPKY